MQFKIHYEIDEPLFDAEIKRFGKENQEIFRDVLMEPLRKAASAVIYGNFMGSGPYNPRPIGKFSSPRSRYYRGWVETNYGSQRARLSGGKKPRVKGGEEQSAHSLDHLRNTVLVNSLKDLSSVNPAYKKIAQDASSGKATSDVTGFFKSPLGERMIKRSKAPVTAKSKMRYGVQTGKLAKSWRDLRVFSRGGKLTFEFVPTLGSTTGTPDAQKLTAFLTRHNSPGLLDHSQLVLALREQGIIAR